MNNIITHPICEPPAVPAPSRVDRVLAISLLVFGVGFLLWVVWSMDQREQRLAQLTAFQTCALSDIRQQVRGGPPLDLASYDAIAARCRNSVSIPDQHREPKP